MNLIKFAARKRRNLIRNDFMQGIDYGSFSGALGGLGTGAMMGKGRERLMNMIMASDIGTVGGTILGGAAGAEVGREKLK